MLIEHLKRVYAEFSSLARGGACIWKNRSTHFNNFTNYPKAAMNHAFNVYYYNIAHKTPLATTTCTIAGTYVLGEAIAQNITGHHDLLRIGIFGAYGFVFGGPAYYYWFNYLDKVPGIILTKTKTYHDFIADKLPVYLSAYFNVVTSRNVNLKATVTSQFEANNDYIEIDGKPSNNKVLIKSGMPIFNGATVPVDIEIKGIKMQPKYPEKINKWVVKATKLLMDQAVFSSLYTLFFMVTIGKMTGMSAVDITGNVVNNFWTIYKMDCLVWPPAQIINFSYVPKSLQPIFVNFVNIGWNAYLCIMMGGH